MRSFLARFGSLFSLVLSGFDRLRFRGESRVLNNAKGVDRYLYEQKVKYISFVEHTTDLTKRLSYETEASARAEGVPIKHLDSSRIDKQETCLELAREHGRTTGRIALVSAVENCVTYRMRTNKDGWMKPFKETRRCKAYYHYFLHEELGLCYVRVQTWFPFQIRVGINGREWLARQLDRRGVGFEKVDNLILAVDDPDLAQQLLDQQRRIDWVRLLDDLVRPVQPLWGYLHGPAHVPYYWMTEQSEWATDFVFHSPDELAYWYKRWLRHGIDTLSCRDVMRYLGKKVPNLCKGEAKIDLREREEGTRIKFWYETNSLKAYDKGRGRAVRLEDTINQPRGFKVYRTKEGEPEDAPKSWQPMRKGVADLDRRAEVSHAAVSRLAESLATVADTTTLGELLKPLGQAVIKAGKRKGRALNPLTGADGELLRELARGDYLINGFRNKDLRTALHGQTDDSKERRRQSAAITRKLALLKAHGLIVKVQKTHRYQLSARGRRITAALSAAHQYDTNRFTTCV
jgi:hypothetical protein